MPAVEIRAASASRPTVEALPERNPGHLLKRGQVGCLHPGFGEGEQAVPDQQRPADDRTPTYRKLTRNEVRALVGRLKEITAVLADADPGDKRAVYAELGVNLTYEPGGTLLIRAGAPQVNACTNEGVGGLRTLTLRGVPAVSFATAAPCGR